MNKDIEELVAALELSLYTHPERPEDEISRRLCFTSLLKMQKKYDIKSGIDTSMSTEDD